MRYFITTILTLLVSVLAAKERVDPLLGEGFSVETFNVGCDYSGDIRSTLIRLHPIVEGRESILYVHGYNDYFFQSDMARRFRDSLYNFYAVDLRRYGRSLSADQTPFEVRNLKEYFDDIDAAVEMIKSEGATKIILMGHSTGGLIASYYVGSQQDDPSVDGLILNSPYLGQNLSWVLRNVALPVVSALGYYFPTADVYQDTSTLYFDSLHQDGHGEWLYDPTLKMKISPPITMGWLRAIDMAQRVVQRGFSIEIPILLMYSDKSVYSDVWTEELQRGDAVLNVEQIAQYGSRLGVDVTHVEVKDGMHDLILSRYEAREATYRAIFEWLDGFR